MSNSAPIPMATILLAKTSRMRDIRLLLRDLTAIRISIQNAHPWRRVGLRCVTSSIATTNQDPPRSSACLAFDVWNECSE